MSKSKIFLPEDNILRFFYPLPAYWRLPTVEASRPLCGSRVFTRSLASHSFFRIDLPYIAQNETDKVVLVMVK